MTGNEDLLAEHVARLLAGHYLYVARVLHGGEERELKVSPEGLRKLKQLVGKQASDGLQYQRDGWLFQMISWVSIQLSLGPNAAIHAPHPQPAYKGIDTLYVEWSQEKGALTSVTIGEDKATENPRSTVRVKVWPEFQAWESGERDAELLSTVSMVLAGAKVTDPERMTEDIFWGNLRRYRVAITAQPPDDQKTREALFDGYSGCVPGDIDRRRADVFLTADVRSWLEAFSVKVVGALDKLGGV